MLTFAIVPFAGTITRVVDWLKNYKTLEGKPANPLVSDIPSSVTEAISIIDVCNERWRMLKDGTSSNEDGWWVGRRR